MIFSGLTNGEYLIHLTAEADRDTEAVITTNHRRFLFRGPMKKGEKITLDFAVALRDADFQKRGPYRDTEIELNAEGCNISAEIEKVSRPALYCLGDSTVCDQEYTGGDEKSRCCGWGQTLGMYLGDKYAVSNHAEQGTHTDDCLSCHFIPVLNQLRDGDTVLMQFGHNDQKNSWLDAFGGYKANLIKIANAILERGAEPIICTPINRLIYIDGKLNTYLDDWAAAAREAAMERNLRCIDLHKFTSETYLRLGKAAEDLFYHSPDGLDRTHMNDLGGVLVGEYAAMELIK